ncbi:MAG: DNA primase [Rhodospirillaceae bacterium]|nr:DNA primase [Rhodospirillaceae bacterium]MCA8934278.1 DNA primase [Rhodospirillaceae bacterium]
MRFPPEFLDEIRARLPVSQVVGRSVNLQRRGREFVGLSPFNKERTPSFTVNDEKGFYHCFSSQEHGDIFTYLMKTQGLSFAEAVERLAGEAGLEVPQQNEREREQSRRRADALTALDAACRFFQAELKSAAGRSALDYLRGRGLDDDAVETFRLGFAPPDSQALLKALAGIGIGEELAIEAGLARKPDDGRAAYSFFRNRVVFPVADARDRVVGFGARLMAGEGPKYINSADSPLFQKGHLLYGLSRARRAAHDGAPVIVAEGYMDVIALVRAGFNGAVAPLGTAFTEHQAQLIWRFCREPVVCFDGDNAGRAAAGRAAERLLPLLRPDHTVRVALLPAGQDPDDLIRAHGPRAMAEVIDDARSLADVVWELECARHHLNTPEGRAGLQAALEAQAGRIADATVARFYRQEFTDRVRRAFQPAAETGRSGERRPWRPARRGDRGYSAPGTLPPIGPRPSRKAGAGLAPERLILAALLADPRRFEPMAEEIGGLVYEHPDDISIHRAVCSVLMQHPDLDSSALKDHFAQVGLEETVARIGERIRAEGVDWLAGAATPEQLEDAWQRAWRAVEVRRIERELADVSRTLREQPSAAVLARQQALLAQRDRYLQMDGA